MGMRDEIVTETIEWFVDSNKLNPSVTDIRLVSNDVGEAFVDRDMMTRPQWERISQARTVELVKSGLKKKRNSRAY